MYILAFLKKFRAACDSIGVPVGAALRLFPHFMKNPASLSLSARLLSRKLNSSGLYQEGLFSYVEFAKFLLKTYGTDDIIAHVVKYLERYKQVPGMARTELAKKLYTRALRCGLVYEEDKVGYYWSKVSKTPLATMSGCTGFEIRPSC